MEAIDLARRGAARVRRNALAIQPKRATAAFHTRLSQHPLAMQILHDMSQILL